MKVLYAELSSCLKPLTASWAASKGEIALTAKSRLASSTEIEESGSLASITVRDAAVIVVSKYN